MVVRRMVVISSAPLARIAGGVLPALRQCPPLFNKHLCLTGRQVHNVAFATVGHVDPIELVRKFLREPDLHWTERNQQHACPDWRQLCAAPRDLAPLVDGTPSPFGVVPRAPNCAMAFMPTGRNQQIRGSSPGAGSNQINTFRRLIGRWIVPVFLASAVACGGNSPTTSPSMPLILDGSWSGNTVQGTPNSLFFTVRNEMVSAGQFTVTVSASACTASFAFAFGSTAITSGGTISSNRFSLSGNDRELRADGSVHMTFLMSGTFTSSNQANGSLMVTTDNDSRYNCAGTAVTTWFANK